MLVSSIATSRRCSVRFSDTKTKRFFSEWKRQSSTLSSLADATSLPATPTRIIQQAQLQNNGKCIDISFNDNTAYRFHAAWIKDSLPSAIGPETHRISPTAVWNLSHTVATKVVVEKDTLNLTFGNDTSSEPIHAAWIKSWAPFVGKPLTPSSKGMHMTPGTSSLFEPLMAQRVSWTANSLDLPKFDAQRLLDGDVDYQIAFLEYMIDPGVALIENVGAPDSLERSVVGKPLERLIFEVVGKMNAHPIRSSRYGVIEKKRLTTTPNQGKDYNASDPLSMHTDHSPYHGIPGFLQFMYQAEGSVMSKVCDGLAVAQHIREHFSPRIYEILCTLDVTHSIRSRIYTKEGKSRDMDDPTSEPWEFELVHTHPILQENKDGIIERIIQGETKRGICSFDFDRYEEIMEAYKIWTQLCEDPLFVKSFPWPEHTVLVTNNWRILHGRASVPPEVDRTMVFGYANRLLADNRYRLLKMRQYAKAHNISEDVLLRMPNQVLLYMLESAATSPTV